MYAYPPGRVRYVTVSLLICGWISVRILAAPISFTCFMVVEPGMGLLSL